MMIFLLVIHLLVCAALTVGILLSEGNEEGMSASIGGYTRERTSRGAKQEEPLDKALKYLAWGFYALSIINAFIIPRIF